MATGKTTELIQLLHRAVPPRAEAGRTDGQLLRDYVRRRDQAALAVLVRRHAPMVWGVCRRVLGSHHDAEDAFQATFLVLVRKAASIASPERLANWLYGVAHQTALKARATTGKRRLRERQVMEMPEPAASAPDPWHDLLPFLDQELSRLPEKYRVAIVLCELEGKTRKEAARQLGVPEGTLAARLARGRAMLAKRLARHGLVVSGATLAAGLSSHAASANVPVPVVSFTIQAASLFAAGQAAAPGAISVKAIALAEGVLKTMLLTKLKMAAAVLLVVTFLGAGAVALSVPVPAEQKADQPLNGKQALAGPAGKETKEPATRAAKEKKEADFRKLTVSGVVKAVEAATSSLAVTHRDGEDTFTVARDAQIDIDGKSGTLARLPVGANVTLSQFVEPKTAGRIQAGGRSYFGNPVKAVDAVRNTITIKDRDEEKTFAVAPDAAIWVDGKGAKLAAVPPGSFVQLGLAADQQTVRYLGADGPCLGGCGGSLVKAVDTNLNTITFADKAMAEVAGKTFAVARDAGISIDGKPGTLAALPVGSYVNLTLCTDGQTARQVHANGPSNVCDCHGSPVKAVDVANGTITFDDKARAEVAGKTFTLAKDTIIAIDGKPGTLADLPPGSYVQMSLRTDGQTVGQLHAQGPSNVCDCGGSCVTAVDVEKGTITFADKARAEVAGKTFTVAKNANLVIDGRTGKLADLPAGAYVQMSLCVDRQTVGTINATGPAVPGVGVVKAVDAEKNTITVEDQTYPVATSANILVDGKTIKLAGVPTGVYVTLRLCVDQKTVGTIFHAKAP